MDNAPPDLELLRYFIYLYTSIGFSGPSPITSNLHLPFPEI